MATIRRTRIALHFAVLAYAWPMLAWAMTQCPPSQDGRSWTMTALAALVLLGFGLAGAMVPVASFRATAGTRRLRRALLLLLALLGMLAVWLLGLWVFFFAFVLTCATF